MKEMAAVEAYLKNINTIVRFVQAVKDSIQDTPLAVEVSAPFHEDGVWTVDFRCGDYTLVIVQCGETTGFGLSTNPTVFSSSPDERFLDFTEATTRTIDLIRARELVVHFPSCEQQGIVVAQ